MNKQLVVGVGIGVAVAAVIGAMASLRSGNIEASKPQVTQSVAQSLKSEPESVAPAAAMEPVAAPVVSGTMAASVSKAASISEAPSNEPAARYALVLASSPVVVNDKIAREECKDVQVQKQKEIKDQNKIAGTAIGAVVGGVLGNQIGDGDGQRIATVAGAVAGGYAGRKIQDRMQKGATETVTEKQCHTVYDTNERTNGYRVRYELDGTVRTVRMKNDPGVGTRIPADDKRLKAS